MSGDLHAQIPPIAYFSWTQFRMLSTLINKAQMPAVRPSCRPRMR